MWLSSLFLWATVLVQSMCAVYSWKFHARNLFSERKGSSNPTQNQKSFGIIASAALLSSSLFLPLTSNAIEQRYKLPPIDVNDKNRCALVSSSIGQANAARDKLYDLRQCDLKGQSGAGKDMSGMIAAEADFSGVNLKEAQISKAYAKNAKFVKADLTNAVVDRVVFEGANLEGAVFANAVLSGTTFEGANLKDTDFTDSYLGPFDLRNLCANPTLTGKNPVSLSKKMLQ